jgi:hypothetical protein
LNNTFEQITSENSIDTLFFTRKVQADQRRKEVAELARKFNEQVKLFELKLVHGAVNNRMLSLSFTCLPYREKEECIGQPSATPSKISYQQRKNSQNSHDS